MAAEPGSASPEGAGAPGDRDVPSGGAGKLAPLSVSGAIAGAGTRDIAGSLSGAVAGSVAGGQRSPVQGGLPDLLPRRSFEVPGP